MPTEHNDGAGNGGDDAAAVATSAAAKAASDAAAAAAAANGVGNGAGDGEAETIEGVKAKLKKVEEERDNYKAGLLKRKADDRNLNAGAGDGQVPATVVVDEKKISDTATAATNKALREAGEKVAKRAFLKAHPDYLDDAQWTSLLTYLTFKGNEITAEEITDRLEAAVLEQKRSIGKLDEYLESERERARREGRIEGQMDAGRSGGDAGDRGGSGRTPGVLSPQAEGMSRAMHTDPEKVRKIDPTKDSSIDISKV